MFWLNAAAYFLVGAPLLYLAALAVAVVLGELLGVVDEGTAETARLSPPEPGAGTGRDES